MKRQFTFLSILYTLSSAVFLVPALSAEKPKVTPTLPEPERCDASPLGQIPGETILFAVHGGGTTTGYYVSSAHLRDMPAWNPSTENPPVSASVLIATAMAANTGEPELKSAKWRFTKLEISEIAAFKGLWLCKVTLSARRAPKMPGPEVQTFRMSGGGSTSHNVYFLHDGTMLQSRVIKKN